MRLFIQIIGFNMNTLDNFVCQAGKPYNAIFKQQKPALKRQKKLISILSKWISSGGPFSLNKIKTSERGGVDGPLPPPPILSFCFDGSLLWILTLLLIEQV